MPVHQQLAGSGGIRVDVGRGGGQGRDVAAEQVGLVIAQQHVAFGDLGATLTQGLDLPTFQGDAGLHVLLNEELEPRLLVEGDGIGAAFVFFTLAAHASL